MYSPLEFFQTKFSSSGNFNPNRIVTSSDESDLYEDIQFLTRLLNTLGCLGVGDNQTTLLPGSVSLTPRGPETMIGRLKFVNCVTQMLRKAGSQLRGFLFNGSALIF